MKVIGIEPLDKRRRKVILDEGFALALYGGELRRYDIREGGELAPEVYEEIISTVLCRRARERMVYILKASDKTEAELRNRLKEAYYPEAAIEAAILFGREHHYIDDTRFTEQYIRYQGRKKSRRQLVCELQQKGVDRDIITRCLEACPVDESEQARTYLRKKGLEGRALSREEQQKAGMALARKGISWEVIRGILEDRSGFL